MITLNFTISDVVYRILVAKKYKRTYKIESKLEFFKTSDYLSQHLHKFSEDGMY